MHPPPRIISGTALNDSTKSGNTSTPFIALQHVRLGLGPETDHLGGMHISSKDERRRSSPTPFSYARSQPAGDTLLARAPKSVPHLAVCTVKPDGRRLTSSGRNVSSLAESFISRWSQP